MDYKEEYLKLKKKYKILKKNGGSIEYKDLSQKNSFEATILNDYSTAISYINTMRTNTFYRLSYNLYHSLKFYQHYSTTLQKNVFKSNYICGGNWYFNIKVKSYMYTNLGVIIPNQSSKYYVELVLLLKTSVCTQSNNFIMPSTLQTSLYTDPYAKAYKEYKKKKKIKEKQQELDDLEDSLEDKESELEEKKNF